MAIDNSSLTTKLAIRKYMLDKWSQEPIRVLDCCAGKREIWTALQKDYDVKEYLAADVKATRGNLRVDSRRLVADKDVCSRFDVIDVDTYGSPWTHWESIIKNCGQDVTVFLTMGRSGGQKAVDGAALEMLGLNGLDVPAGIRWRLADLCVSYCLTKCYDYGIILKEAVETRSPGSGGANYYGIRLRRRKNGSNLPTKGSGP